MNRFLNLLRTLRSRTTPPVANATRPVVARDLDFTPISPEAPDAAIAALPQMQTAARLTLALPADAPDATSWAGGNPDLPHDEPWPHFDDQPLSFLVRIDCRDLPVDVWGGVGPRTGWLSLFMDPRYPQDSTFPVCVLHHEDRGAPRSAPQIARPHFTARDAPLPRLPIIIDAGPGNDGYPGRWTGMQVDVPAGRRRPFNYGQLSEWLMMLRKRVDGATASPSLDERLNGSIHRGRADGASADDLYLATEAGRALALLPIHRETVADALAAIDEITAHTTDISPETALDGAEWDRIRRRLTDVGLARLKWTTTRPAAPTARTWTIDFPPGRASATTMAELRRDAFQWRADWRRAADKVAEAIAETSRHLTTIAAYRETLLPQDVPPIDQAKIDAMHARLSQDLANLRAYPKRIAGLREFAEGAFEILDQAADRSASDSASPNPISPDLKPLADIFASSPPPLLEPILLPRTAPALDTLSLYLQPLVGDDAYPDNVSKRDWAQCAADAELAGGTSIPADLCGEIQAELRAHLSRGIGRMGGLPRWEHIHSELFHACRYSNGPDRAAYLASQKYDIFLCTPEFEADHALLFQLHSEDAANWMFGDGSHLIVVISRPALAAGRWHEARGILSG
ncbi:YwqG family protein [Jannaschia sp.]|nr:YwqG family protein [Jannaschia sp.]